MRELNDYTSGILFGIAIGFAGSAVGCALSADIKNATIDIVGSVVVASIGRYHYKRAANVTTLNNCLSRPVNKFKDSSFDTGKCRPQP